MHIIRRAALALALLAVPISGLAAASPALADHNAKLCWDGTNQCDHWGNRYSPPVYANAASQSLTDWVQDAGYTWQDNGFVQGWNPGAFPAYSAGGCADTTGAPSWIDGAIRVCLVPASHVKLAINGTRFNSLTYTTRLGRCDTSCLHIYAAVVYINSQADTGTIQRAFRHGFGEALGMTNTSTYASVMNVNPWSPYVQQHDRDVMYAKYGSHISG